MFNYKQFIDIQKKDVELEQERAVKLIEKTVMNIALVGLITICSYIVSGCFIARSISSPIKSLKLATIEVAKDNLHALIESKSKKDEIGDFAVSFSYMIENLKKSREDLVLAKNYTKKSSRV